MPHVGAAARVEPGGRLIKKQHRRVGDQRPRQVEASLHAAGVGLRRSVGSVEQVELGEQFASALTAPPPAEMVQPADHVQVLESGQVLIDGRVLARQPDARAHLMRVRTHIDPGDRGRTGIRQQQGAQDAHHRRLARAVWTKESEHRAGGDSEVYAIERRDLVVPLDKTRGLNGVRSWTSEGLTA